MLHELQLNARVNYPLIIVHCPEKRTSFPRYSILRKICNIKTLVAATSKKVHSSPRSVKSSPVMEKHLWKLID